MGIFINLYIGYLISPRRFKKNVQGGHHDV